MVHKKWKFIIPLILLLIFGLPTTSYAHGARIEYTINVAIDIVASYDNGEPMAGAQIVVYAPDNPSSAWLTGVCDDEGSTLGAFVYHNLTGLQYHSTKRDRRATAIVRGILGFAFGIVFYSVSWSNPFSWFIGLMLLTIGYPWIVLNV